MESLQFYIFQQNQIICHLKDSKLAFYFIYIKHHNKQPELFKYAATLNKTDSNSSQDELECQVSMFSLSKSQNMQPNILYQNHKKVQYLINPIFIMEKPVFKQNIQQHLQFSTTQEQKFIAKKKYVFCQKIQILLLIYLKSSSGRIPAGNVIIDLNSIKKGVNKIQTNILKCPDKSASIFFSIAIQTLSQTNIRPNEQQKDYRPSYKDLSTPRSQYIAADRRSLHSQKELYQSKVSKGSSKDQRQSQGGYSTRLSQFIMRNKQDQIDQQRQKIRQLQRQKSDALKQVRSMKNSVRGGTQRQKSNQSRGKIRQLQKQLQSQKDKISNYQLQITKRSHKQTQLQKDYKTLSKKYQQLKLDHSTMTNKKQTFEKNAKQLQNQYKIIKEKYQDSILASENNIKRSDFKENVLKQQIKTLNQKYTSSQSQKQRLILQKNDIIMEFEQRQRTSRLGFKQKQKVHNEQKNKQNKKIDFLTKQLDQCNQLKKQLQNKLAQIVKQNKSLQLQFSDMQITLYEARTEINDMQIRFGSQEDKKKQRQKSEDSLKVIQEQKKKIKKVLQEKQQQIVKIQKTILNHQVLQQKLTKKVQELEHSLKQKTAANKILQRQYQTTIKQCQNIKKQSKMQQKKLQDITFSKQNQTSKFTSLNEQIKQLDKKHFDQIKNMNNLLMQKEGIIVKLKVQLDQANYQQENYNKRLFELQKELEEMSTQVNHKYIENQNLISQAQELHQRLVQLQQKNTNQITRISQLQRQNEFALIQNSNSLRIANQKISTLQRQLEQISSTSSQELVQISLRYQKLQATIRSRQEQIRKLNDKITDLETLRVKNQADLSQQEYQLRIKINQINFLKQQLETSRKEFSQLDQQCKMMSINMEQKEQQIFMLKQKNQSLFSQNANKQNTSIKYLEQFENFKLNNMNSLRVFFSAINSQQNVELNTLVPHEEDELNRFIKQSIANKNSYIKAMTKEIKRLESITQDLEETIKTLNKENIQKTKSIQELQGNAKTLSEKANQNSSSLQSVNQALKKQIQNLNTKIVQLQSQVNMFQQELINVTTSLTQQQSLKTEQTKKYQTLQQTFNIFKQTKQDCIRQKQSQIKQLTKQLNKLSLQVQKSKRSLQQGGNTLSNLQQKNSEITKNLKDQRVNNKNIAKQIEDKKVQIQRISKQLTGLKAQLQTKKETIIKNNQNQQQLRNTIKSNQEQNKILKQQNIKISKINEKTITREKELEDLINNARKSNVSLNDKVNQLQKTLKQKQTQIGNLKETIYNVEQAKNKATKQNQTTTRIKKLHEDQVVKLENIIKNLKVQNEKALQKIKEDDKNTKLKEIQYKKQLKQLSTHKDVKQQGFKEFKKKYEVLEQSTKRENQKLNAQNQKLKKDYQKSTLQSAQNKSKAKQLQNRLTSLLKQMESLQKSSNLQTQYMKPIKQEIGSLKQLISLQHKFIDQFQINKNKLVKMGHYKLDTYNQKFSFQIVREITLSIQKCKTQLLSKISLTNSANNQKDKLLMVQEFNKVQKIIDKFNRAESK